MKPQEDLIITDFIKGIADSALVGFEDMRNLDVLSISGAVRVNRAPVKASSTTVTDTIKWIVHNPGGNYYALGDTGKVYKSTSGSGSWSVIAGNTTTSANGQGLAIYKNYLVVARQTAVDVMKISDETWTNGWAGLTLDTDAAWHPMLVGQDDVLYIGNGFKIASVAENAGSTFTPGTSSTYTANAAALDTLPTQYRVKCLTELGTDLMIGTIVGSNDYGGEFVADIFRWDRDASSAHLPLRLNEMGVHQMITVNNVTYIVAGNRGAIYATNGTAVKLLRRLPENMITYDSAGFFYNLFPGAIISLGNSVVFGVSSGSIGIGEQGLGCYRITLDGRLTFDSQISTDTTTNTNALYISALYPLSSDQYLIGWRDNTTYGIDAIGTSRYTTYKAYADSPLFEVGTPLRRRTYTEAEVILTKPFSSSGQGVRIKYRKHLSDSFVTAATVDYATYGTSLTLNVPVSIQDLQTVQFRIEYAEAGSTPFVFKEIRLR